MSSPKAWLTVLVAGACLALPAAAGAATRAPFGHVCLSTAGVRFCPTTDAGPGQTVDGVPSFDGVPLDVDVTLPAVGNGPFPTIVIFHGWGGSKTTYEASSPDGLRARRLPITGTTSSTRSAATRWSTSPRGGLATPAAVG